MKKIFAIALALVMVLSMASAFASPCMGGFDWTCATAATNCGKGKVEVIPYVKVNNGCGSYDWQASECASAVSSENVFYAVKLTVDANADKEWWEQASVALSYKGMDKKAVAPALDSVAGLPTVIENSTDVKASDVNTFYYDFSAKGNAFTGWQLVTDTFEFGSDYINTVKVGDSSKTKVCATLKSAVAYDKGMAGVVGNYYVEYVEAADAVKAAAATKATMTYTFDGVDGATAKGYTYRTGWSIISVTEKGNKTTVVVEAKNAGKLDDAIMADLADDAVNGVLPKVKNGKDEVKAVAGVVNAIYVYDEVDGGKGEWLAAYYIYDGKIYDVEYSQACGSSYRTIKDFFGLDIDVCVSEKLIKANFGWEDKFEHCYAWKNSAPSIVDAECVVAIPKTGDASVLAWLF